MYKKAVNFLRGNVRVQVETAYPERMLNLCGEQGILFWDLQWRSPISFSLRTTRKGLRQLRQLCDESTEITIIREQGVPILWRRIKTHYVLLGGLVLFWLLLFGGNLFIWDFEVSGNQSVPTETILRALEHYGLTIGSPGITIDQEDLRNHVLLEVHDISWLAVNVKGCTAHVQVVERLRPPEGEPEDEVCNVVAKRGGLVTKVEALGGEAMVLPGSTVTEGELLISGVADSERHGMRLMHGYGQVRARTWYDLSVSVPLKQEEKGEMVKRRRHLALDFGKRRLKFYGKGSVSGEECDKIIKYKPSSIMGLRLPLTWVVEECTYYQKAQTDREISAARQEGEALLLQELTEQIGADGTVEEKRFAVSRQGNVLLVTLRAECEEQIGQSVPVAVE